MERQYRNKNRKNEIRIFCTVFQAELYAIYRAGKSAKGMDNVNIMSDSISALEIIKKTLTIFTPLPLRSGGILWNV